MSCRTLLGVADVRFGGKGEDRCYNDIWMFNAIENTWTEAGVMGDTPAPRHSHAACVIGHLIYVFGGETYEGVALDDLFAFNTNCIPFVQKI